MGLRQLLHKVTVKRFFIHCKGPGMKRSVLLGSDAGGDTAHTTTKRVHAARIAEGRVAGTLKELHELNPDWSFRAWPAE